ncbi:MAG: hypothetical protein OQK27_06440 [Gammaproteobacteria bacterium]|nr:hypothetical protein [Gammaproteobacteria bacterium]
MTFYTHAMKKNPHAPPSNFMDLLLDAVLALEDENVLTIVDRDANELMFKTLGMGP